MKPTKRRVVVRTERGWGGHFICAYRCRFRRNTLLECGEIRIVVSTVGSMWHWQAKEGDGKSDTIGHDRYSETMVFHSDPKDARYHDADVGRGEVPFEAPWSIDHDDADDEANAMHEAVVAELTTRLLAGDKLPTYDERYEAECSGKVTP